MNNHSLKIRKITLKNFIGIRNGLNKHELTIDFKKLMNKDIIVILGENGTGKSTLSSVLHALPGTTDKRNKFIIEDKEGVKKVLYERDDGIKYSCKIIYTPTKTGHSTKGFIEKTDKNGETVELNPNGNISSYKDILADELGLTESILKLANQNDVCKGHVDMTSTERKVNMSTFLPEDIYSDYFNIVDKTYREMKTRINILVEAIGKMHDDATIEKELKRTTEKINILVAKRDKCIAKINELKTRIEILKDEDITKREKEIDSKIKDFNKELEKIASKLEFLHRENLSNILPSEDSNNNKKIDKILKELKSQLEKTKIDRNIIINSISDLKDKRNSLSKDIQGKESILADINTDLSLNQLKDLLKEYKSKFNELDKLISKLDTTVTKSDFMIGFEIVDTVRKFIDSIREYDYDLVQYVITHDYSDIEKDAEDVLEYKDKLIQIKSGLENKIIDLNSNSEMKDILDKRPSDCKIDNCPFIENARKWLSIEKEIDVVAKALEDANSKLNKAENKLSLLNEYKSIHDKIEKLLNYIDVNNPIIRKLPYSDKYSTEKAIMKVIEKGSSMLSNCDNFDEFIDILESKEEYQDLKFRKIPTIENDIRMIETQGKFISSAKDDLENLQNSYENVKKQIADKESKLETLTDKEDYLEKVIDALITYTDKKNVYDTIAMDMSIAFDELKVVKRKLEEMDEYKDKLKDKKERLEEIEEELQPLTRERELYKMEQLKIADHKQELASIEEDMFKCEIIRESLSVKGDGIPVGALEYFMDIVRSNANVMLSNAFNGALYLEEFIINSKDFIIPYKKNGDSGMDVSFASSSERSFISLCLTLAIIEETVSKYGIVILDEIDRGFGDNAKYKFIDILGTQIRRIGIKQVFMVSHNYSFYEGYDIGYLCFPGSNLTNKDKESVIEIEYGA